MFRTTLVLFVLTVFFNSLKSTAESDTPTILVIFDFSSHMAVREADGFRYEIALDLLKKINFSSINCKLGLMVFGSNGTDSGNEDISILVNPAFDTEKEILARLNVLIPNGESPLAQALISSKELLGRNNKNYIVLISAGIENCGGNPVDAARTLLNDGYISKIFCIGFGENNLMNEIARNANGIYYNIAQFSSLKNELVTAIYGEENISSHGDNTRQNFGKLGYRSFIKKSLRYPAYGTNMVLKDMNGNVFRKMSYWRGILENIPPGTYVIEVSNGDETHTDTIRINAGDFPIQNYEFDIETGTLSFRHLIKGAPEGRAYGTFTQINHENGETVYTGSRWSGEIPNLPIANYVILASNSSINKEKTVTIRPNTTTEVVFNFELSTGRIAYKCFLDPEKRRIAYGTIVRILRLPIEELAFENREQWRGTTSLIPPGNYRIEGEYQGNIKKEEVYVGPDSTVNYDFIFNIKKIKFSYKCYRNQKNSPANGTIVEIINSTGLLVERLQGWRGALNLTEGSYTIRAQYQGKLLTRNIQLSLDKGAAQEEEFYFGQ